MLSEQAHDLRVQCVSDIHKMMNIPDLELDINVPITLWRGMGEPPTLVKAKMFDDKENPAEGILTDGTHYINGEVKVLYQDEADEEENYVGLDDLDLETLCDLTEQIYRHTIVK